MYVQRVTAFVRTMIIIRGYSQFLYRSKHYRHSKHIGEIKKRKYVYFLLIRPRQIGILLSVRVRVGFRVLNPIKNCFVGENLNNSDVPGFRNKYNYTIIKTLNMHVLPNTYLCECLLGWTC